MSFSVLRRLDFQDFDFSYLPLALCGNGGVLLTTNGGTAEVTTFGGGKKILFGGVPRYYISPASGPALALDQPAQTYATLIALSDANVALSSNPIGIYEPPNGVFHAFGLNPAVNPQVTAMNSSGWILGCNATSQGPFPWLMVPTPVRGEFLTSQFNYTSVPLSDACEKAGITKGLGFGITPLAINDAGWVLLAGPEGPAAIVDMSNTGNPTVLYANIPIGSGRSTFMSSNGWVAQQAATEGSSSFLVYNSGAGASYTAQLEKAGDNNNNLSIGGINNLGMVVGTEISVEADDVNAGRGFCWDPVYGPRSLTSAGLPSGDRVIGAAGINDAGQIAAGVQAEKSGSNYAVVLTVA